MELKIINMADRMKDRDDQQLKMLFSSEPISDGDFSVRIVSRIRRRIWVRRLALPIACVAGIVFCAKYLMQLAQIIPDLLDSVPVAALGIDRLPIDGLPPVSTLIMGAALLATVMMIGSMLEES